MIQACEVLHCPKWGLQCYVASVVVKQVKDVDDLGIVECARIT